MVFLSNAIFVHFPALRSLDLGMNQYRADGPFTTPIAPLTYLRLFMPTTKSLVDLMSVVPLSETLRQLHVRTGTAAFSPSRDSMPSISIRMVNLHTFTLVQNFFSILPIEWTHVELLTSSKVMPVLQRANIAVFLNTNDFNRISSAPLFGDHRQVVVNFAFNLINCPRYTEMTQLIPRGNQFHPREIVGATFKIASWSEHWKWAVTGDPYVSVLLLRK